MKGFLTDNQLHYVLYHLNHSVELYPQLTERMRFEKDGGISGEKPEIIFRLSGESFSEDRMRLVEEIPVLFAGDTAEDFFTIEDKHVIFHHDLLKSSFYLLSGYQELDGGEPDHMNRFPFRNSLQARHGFTTRPLVNEYFSILISGIEAFCRLNGISFRRIRPFEPFALFLSHDVDVVDLHGFKDGLFWLKNALVQQRRNYSRKFSLGLAIKYIRNSTGPGKRENPAWSFDYLVGREKAFEWPSTFYFLPKGKRHTDASYSFSEARIRTLFAFLEEEACEIALHGTAGSSVSRDEMTRNVKEFESASGFRPGGIRQHQLRYDIRLTPAIHEDEGFHYDASLGFAEHEGFRHSYCLPFRPYDHEADRMRDLWEIPLHVMDATLFHYRSYSMEQAMQATEKVVREVFHHGGVFSLLWHNSFFDEDLFPGIRLFYENLLASLGKRSPQGLTGRGIIERMNALDQLAFHPER